MTSVRVTLSVEAGEKTTYFTQTVSDVGGAYLSIDEAVEELVRDLKRTIYREGLKTLVGES